MPGKVSFFFDMAHTDRNHQVLAVWRLEITTRSKVQADAWTIGVSPFN